MPNLNDYLAGFKIEKGLALAGYTLQRIHGEEMTVTRYREYEYHISLHFVATNRASSPEKLLEAVKDWTKEERVVYTEYHNPYLCNFGELYISATKTNGEVLIKTIGHAKRIGKK